jgi:hypothetical protein
VITTRRVSLLPERDLTQLLIDGLDPKAKATDLGAGSGMPKIEIEKVTTTADTGASATA